MCCDGFVATPRRDTNGALVAPRSRIKSNLYAYSFSFHKEACHQEACAISTAAGHADGGATSQD